MIRFFFFFLFLAPLFSIPIVVMGDSHVRAFEKIPGSRIVHLGPITMHRVGKEGFDPVYLRSQGAFHLLPTVYVFGEIDVRCHIGRQRDLFGRSEEEILATLVDSYLSFIVANQAIFKSSHSIIYNVIPPTETTHNSEYPVYGSIEERIRLTRALNRRLKEGCEKRGLYFIDLYEIYANATGALERNLSDGNVHISSTFSLPIRQKIEQIVMGEPPLRHRSETSHLHE